MVNKENVEIFESLLRMTEREGITEALKAENQMPWVQRMNRIKTRAEKIIIYLLIQPLV